MTKTLVAFVTAGAHEQSFWWHSCRKEQEAVGRGVLARSTTPSAHQDRGSCQNCQSETDAPHRPCPWHTPRPQGSKVACARLAANRHRR